MQIQSTGIEQKQPGGMLDSETPPQSAIGACSSSSQDAACSFATPNGTITGSYQLIQQQLACVPITKP